MSNLVGYLNKGPQHTLSLGTDTNLSFKGKKVNITGNNEIDRWHVGTFSGASYLINVEYDSNNKEIIQALVVAQPDGAKVSIFGRLSTTKLITLTAEINNSYLSLIANPVSTNYKGVRVSFTATYGETIGPVDAATSANSVAYVPLSSEYGFESPGFSVDTSGNITVANLNATQSLTLNGIDFLTQTPSGFASTLGTLTITSALTVTNGLVHISATNGSTIDNVDIGSTTPGAGSFTSLSVSELPTTLSGVTNKQYVDSKITALAIALGA
jgi:hypothetical protein